MMANAFTYKADADGQTARAARKDNCSLTRPATERAIANTRVIRAIYKAGPLMAFRTSSRVRLISGLMRASALMPIGSPSGQAHLAG
jgi:hypothetical protein